MNQDLTSTIIINLSIMLIGIVIIGLVLLKFKKIKQSSLHQLKLIGGIPLGHKERLAVVEFYNKKILIGVTGGQIKTLAIHSEVNSDKIDKEIKRFDKTMQAVLTLKGKK